MKTRFRRKRGPVVAKKSEADGISFASGLEKNMYLLLKEHGLFDKYEGETFELIPSFVLPQEVWERQSNGQGAFKIRSSNIRNMSYTPDFTSYDYIIETKGRANEAFPIRYKAFKQWCYLNNDTRTLYKPQNQKENLMVVEDILKKRKES